MWKDERAKETSEMPSFVHNLLIFHSRALIFGSLQRSQPMLSNNIHFVHVRYCTRATKIMQHEKTNVCVKMRFTLHCHGIQISTFNQSMQNFPLIKMVGSFHL